MPSRWATDTEYGLSLGILTRDVMKGARSWPTGSPAGLVHINDQTVADEAHIPFGGVAAFGHRLAPFGGAAAKHRGVHRDPVGHDERARSRSTPF